MVSQYRRVAVGTALGVVFAAGLFAQGRGQGQAQGQDARAQAAAAAARQVEIQGTVKLADDLAAGGAAPNDFSLTWLREDFLKSGPNTQYVPFIVTVDASKFSGQPVSFYWRVVARTAAPAAPAATVPAGGAAAPAARPRYAYEDIVFLPQVAPAAGGAPTRIARSFAVAAGTYDVYVVMKEPVSAQRGAAPPRAAAVKHTMTVPDFWNGELSTSSILLGRIEPLTAPLTAQDVAERPYAAFGPFEFIPAADTRLSKRGELSTFMQIYNPRTAAENKPDIIVEYTFCQVVPGNTPAEGEACKAGEKFFNKTVPENHNAQTLPPQFDLAAGYQVTSGPTVPLGSFPEGAFRVEVKITDKLANKILTKDLNITIVP
jgi:hypothetical protein